MALIGLSTSPLSAGDPEKPKHPKIDALDRFDLDQSPLQKGMLDARDKQWRKNLKLSDDPACSQLIRVWAKDESADETNNRIRRHCLETDPASGDPVYPGRNACLTKVCGADNLDCANALISGNGIRQACAVTVSGRNDRVEGGRELECRDCGAAASGGITLTQVNLALNCAEEIFRDRGAGNRNRVEECLEDPYRQQPQCDNEPDCVPELKGKCKSVFDSCSEVPFLSRSERKDRRSGDIIDGNGRKVGKRIQTSTVIQYDNATQRGKSDPDLGWDRIRVKSTRPENARHGVPGMPTPSGTADVAMAEKRVLGSDVYNQCDPFALCRANDDQDCVDSVTGKHYSATECFTGTMVGSSRLAATLEMLPPDDCGNFEICCRHVGPTPDTSYCSKTVGTTCKTDGDCPAGEVCQPENTGRFFYGDDCLRAPDSICSDDGRPCVTENDCEAGLPAE